LRYYWFFTPLQLSHSDFQAGVHDYAAVLRVQLTEILAQPRTHIRQTVSGSGNQVIGQVSGGSVVFGPCTGVVFIPVTGQGQILGHVKMPQVAAVFAVLV
jgi:hypothetical protein